LNDTTGNKVGLVKPPVSLPFEIVAIIGSLYAGFDFEDERLFLRHNGIDGETKRGTVHWWSAFRHAFVESCIKIFSILTMLTTKKDHAYSAAS
jgi:hypothetical protein